MIDRRVESIAEALEGVKDGSTVLVGGFGVVGQAIQLIEGLVIQGARDSTIVANNAGVGQLGLPHLMRNGQVRKIICSFPRTADIFSELYREGKLELEIVPQGTLAERMRAAGAGIAAFYTRTGADTLLEQGKETKEFNGKKYLMETALYGDLALVEAWKADRWGNLVYKEAGRNFNPVMATAAKLTVVQAQHIVELGDLDPESIVTPGIYVNRVVHVPYEAPDWKGVTILERKAAS